MGFMADILSSFHGEPIDIHVVQVSALFYAGTIFNSGYFVVKSA